MQNHGTQNNIFLYKSEQIKETNSLQIRIEKKLQILLKSGDTAMAQTNVFNCHLFWAYFFFIPACWTGVRSTSSRKSFLWTTLATTVSPAIDILKGLCHQNSKQITSFSFHNSVGFKLPHKVFRIQYRSLTVHTVIC